MTLDAPDPLAPRSGELSERPFRVSNVLLGGAVALVADTRIGHAGSTRRHVQEPSSRDAADLLRLTSGLGTVERLDAVHTALLEAYRAGQHNPAVK